jgi:hypothetical protein
MSTQRDKLAELDKNVAVISERLDQITHNHLHHIERDVAMLRKTLWTIGFFVFSNLILLLKDLIL